MKTFSWTSNCMAAVLRDKGKYIETSYHLREMAEWDRVSNNNRQLAERLMMEQDKELAVKNKEILSLRKQLKDKTDDQPNHKSTLREVSKISPRR